jgi:carbon storage regulator
MLVLTRKIGEALTIGQGIQVTVLKQAGRHVSLGIEAPKDVPIQRNEIIGKPRRDQPPRAA